MARPSSPRLILTLASLLIAATAAPAAAQENAGRPATGTPAGGFVRDDGTLDLSAAPAGALDLTGMSVTVGADGQLHTAAVGDYADIGVGASGGSVNGVVNAVAVASDGSI